MISELSSLSSKVSLTSFRWTLPSPLTLSICDSNSWLYILLISYHKLIFQMVQNLYWATYLSLLGRFSMQWAMLVRSEHQFLLPLLKDIWLFLGWKGDGDIRLTYGLKGFGSMISAYWSMILKIWSGKPEASIFIFSFVN